MGSSISEISELSPAQVRQMKKMMARNLPPLMLP